MGKHINVIFLLALLSGCAGYPISKDLRDEARPLTMTQITANPIATRGTMIIWGGRIIDTVNNTNGGEIYVLELPLNRRGRPSNNDDASGGRFIALSPEFLDPAVYRRGRLVTVAGLLDGVRNERLQNLFYLYPILNIKEIHLWSSRERNDHYYYYGAYPGYYWGYNPLWWDGGSSWDYPEGYGALHGPNHGDESRSGGEQH